MSYEIIYDKQFIKVDENRFVPMVLAGSNNCYEWTCSGRERRSRSWFPFSVNGSPIATLDEMLEYCKDTRQGIIDRNQAIEKDDWYEEYDDKNFGYWSSIAINGSTRSTTYGQFEGIFKTGCKKALTVEQLHEEGVSVIVRNSWMSSKDERERFSRSVSTTKELLDAVRLCDKFYEDCDISTTIEFGWMSDDKAKRLRKKYFSNPKKEKELKQLEKYWTILVDGNYLARYTSSGYKYAYYPYIKLATKKEAEARVKRYNKKYPNRTHEVEEVNSPTSMWV